MTRQTCGHTRARALSRSRSLALALALRAQRWLWKQWQEIHSRALTPVSVTTKSDNILDWRPLVVLLVATLSLTFQEYFGQRNTFAQLFPATSSQIGATGWWDLWSFVWWTGWRVFGYLVLPLLVIALIPGERLGDYGFTFRGFTKHLWIYGLLFLGVLPVVVAVSYTKPFQHTYPFYRLASRSAFDFATWELLYAVQFLSLEFFFRGFLLHGLKRSIGAHAIWVMMVPYCMIHYGKPMLETLGAIIAGLVLGTLALRTGSIWCGVLIHVSVAVTMDVLALGHRLGYLGR
ncbi:MAG: type II CAAX endopeptidase family protein [Pseudomonadota bacterium]